MPAKTFTKIRADIPDLANLLTLVSVPTNGIVGNRDTIRVAVVRDLSQAVAYRASGPGRQPTTLGWKSMRE